MELLSLRIKLKVDVDLLCGSWIHGTNGNDTPSFRIVLCLRRSKAPVVPSGTGNLPTHNVSRHQNYQVLNRDVHQ
jgi:hypothetical protein